MEVLTSEQELQLVKQAQTEISAFEKYISFTCQNSITTHFIEPETDRKPRMLYLLRL